MKSKYYLKSMTEIPSLKSSYTKPKYASPTSEFPINEFLRITAFSGQVDTRVHELERQVYASYVATMNESQSAQVSSEDVMTSDVSLSGPLSNVISKTAKHSTRGK